MNDGSSAFGKTICTICYEDLKPIVEDLQAISICGHVFHELCLQQWFEYCSNAKKTTCPVCKQVCCQENAGRLYFQSVGDQIEPTMSRKPFEVEEDPTALRREVKKLEGKLSGLISTFERQQQDLKDVNEELCLYKEKAKKEEALKNDALKQKAFIQQLFHSKSEELVKASSECFRLQERNLALAKELAALKLVSDLSLEEDEVLKLASFGNEGNNKDTIDILKKSLVLRNKSYKELMAQCNILGRGESRSLKKLEKADTKIKKLKTRLQELEMVLEQKDNEALRALKASIKTTSDGVDLNGGKWNTNSSRISKCSSEDQSELPVDTMKNSNQAGSLTNNLSHSGKIDHCKSPKDLGANTFNEDTFTIDLDQEKDSYFYVDEDVSEHYTTLHKKSYLDLQPPRPSSFSKDASLHKSTLSRPSTACDAYREARHGQSIQVELSASITGTKNEKNNASAGVMEEDVKLLLDDITEAPLLHIRKENPCPVPITSPGDQCFSGGLLGPDGANRYLGKWCKRVQRKEATSSSVTMQGSSTSTGNLISVGSDGRGGRIKVLRSQKQSSLDDKGNLLLPKRLKCGAKLTGQQPQGCLQIEHFFGKEG